MAPRFAVTFALLLRASPRAGDPVDNNDRIKTAIKGADLPRAVFKPGGPGAGGLGPGGVVPGAMVLSPVGGTGIGSHALAGLALLESGVSTRDEAVINITRYCREGALSSNATYDISLLIMFFDRLGARSDRPFIQFLTYRLLTGQCIDGSWSYSCVGMQLDPVQANALRATLPANAKLTTPEGMRPGEQKEKPRPRGTGRRSQGQKGPAQEPKGTEEPKEEAKPSCTVDQRIMSRARWSGQHGWHRRPLNTIATVGLWCGRRGVDVERHWRARQALPHCSGPERRMVLHCRRTRWVEPVDDPRQADGLALGFGAKNLKEGDREPVGDPVVEEGQAGDDE